jgi:hypothetical protein
MDDLDTLEKRKKTLIHVRNRSKIPQWNDLYSSHYTDLTILTAIF